MRDFLLLTELDIYRYYLQDRRGIVGHPVGPGSMSSLSQRPDGYCFKQLLSKFVELGMGRSDIKVFMLINRKALGSAFLPINLTKKEAFGRYQTYLKEGGTKASYLIKLRKSLRFIERYLMDSEIDAETYFFSGDVPEVVNHYMEGKVDETILVYSGFFERKELSRILESCLGELRGKVDIVERRIFDNKEVRKILEDSLLKNLM